MSNTYVGTWRIIEMEQWDQDFIDLVVPGYIAFREDHRGEFQFGAVHGDLDYRLAPYQETERLEFSWEGEDEMDSVSGRGWAIIEDGQLQGRLYFHEGDESGFTAEKQGCTERREGDNPCHQHLKAATQTLTRYGGKPTSSHVQPMRMCLPGLSDSAAVSMSTSPWCLPSLNASITASKKSSSKPVGNLSVIRSIQGRSKFRLVVCTSTKMCTMP